MDLNFTTLLLGNTSRERLFSALVLISSWGGLLIAYLLSSGGFLDGAGDFYFGCLVGSFALSALSLIKPRFDIVSCITPVYGIIIFFGMGIPPSVILQILYAATLMILLWRLHSRFSAPKSDNSRVFNE